MTAQQEPADYREQLLVLAGLIVAQSVAVVTAFLAGRLDRDEASRALVSVLTHGNGVAATMADQHVADALTVQTGEPILALGISPPDWQEDRLTAAVDTVLDRASDTVDDEQDDEDRPAHDVERGVDEHAEPVRPDPKPVQPEPKPVVRPEPKPTVRPKPVTPPRDTTPAAEPDVATEPDVIEEAEPTHVETLARSEPLAAAAEAEQEATKRQPLIVAWRRVVSAGACEKCLAWAQDGREFPKKAPFKRHNGCTCSREFITKEDRLNERNSK